MMNKINKDILESLPNEIPAIKFNRDAQEQFANDRGITFTHWVAIPSSIGLQGKGEYRRDTLDTISSNGFIYKKRGEFKATIISNQHQNQDMEGGIFDNSTCYMVIPKYYSEFYGSTEQKEISMLPADRIYPKGISLIVNNYQRGEYNFNGPYDHLQFPVNEVLYLIDSKNKEYKQDFNFKIDDGNLIWIPGRDNPGINIDSNNSNVYGILYNYQAFWYVSRLVSEIRITTDLEGKPQRLPMFIQLQREYVYYSKVKPSPIDINKLPTDNRTNQGIQEPLDPNKYQIKVNTADIEE